MRGKRYYYEALMTIEYSGKRMYVFSLVSIISTSTFIATVAMSMLATLVCPGMSAWVLALAASRMEVKMR